MSKELRKYNVKDKWQNSITFKLFLTTSLLLITLSVFIYITLYILLPSFYRNHKINNLEKGIDILLETAATQTFNDSVDDLWNFAHAYNVDVEFLTLEYKETGIFFPSISLPELIKARGISISSRRVQPSLDIQRHSNYRLISFEDSEYIMYYIMTLQPVDEVANMLFIFIPYIGAVILCFTIVSVAFYSKIITKPLLQINRVAKRMAHLDFDETCVVTSEDEIGQLSKSLNQMSDNLEKAMMELRGANEQLIDDIQKERKLEKKRSEFVATISHELKTPITTVKGQLEAMIYNIGPYKDRDKYLRRSYEVMGEMEHLVREVLSVSKLEHFEPKMEEISLKKLVMSCNDNLDYFYKKKELQLELNLEEVTAGVDPNLMKKAIGNVINNGVKYAPQGAKIKIDLRIQDQCPTLKIYNSGTTIDEKEIEKIFSAFYRVEKSRNRNTGGSGLGLYIVHQILDLHHINYHIKNLNHGVEFTMIFPK